MRVNVASAEHCHCPIPLHARVGHASQKPACNAPTFRIGRCDFESFILCASDAPRIKVGEHLKREQTYGPGEVPIFARGSPLAWEVREAAYSGLLLSSQPFGGWGRSIFST